MSCFCCTKEDETNTELIVNNDKDEQKENNIINNDDKYNNKEALEKIKKIQSKYRSGFFRKLQQNRENLKKVQDKYKKIQSENERLKMKKEDLTSQKKGLEKINKDNNELKLKLERVNKEKDTLLQNKKNLEDAKSQIIQEMKLSKEKLKNAQALCTEITNKNSQLMLKYERLSLAEKYAKEKQSVIDRLRKNQDKLRTENNMLREKCYRLQEVIKLSNEKGIVSFPISFNNSNVKSNNNIRNIKTNVKNKIINAENSNKKRNTEDIHTLEKEGNIKLKTKDIQIYPEIRSNNMNNKIKNTNDENVNQTSIREQARYDAENKINKRNILKYQNKTISYFNGTSQLNNEKANNKNNLSNYRKIFGCFNNKKTKTQNLQKQNNDFLYSKKNTDNSKISNVNNKQELFDETI